MRVKFKNQMSDLLTDSWDKKIHVGINGQLVLQ
jgi:hypothetical protein